MSKTVRDPSTIPPCLPGREMVSDEQVHEYVAWTKTRPNRFPLASVGLVAEGKQGASHLDGYSRPYGSLPTGRGARHYRNPDTMTGIRTAA